MSAITVELDPHERMLMSVVLTRQIEQEMEPLYRLAESDGSLGKAASLPPKVVALENILFKLHGLDPIPSP